MPPLRKKRMKSFDSDRGGEEYWRPSFHDSLEVQEVQCAMLGDQVSIVQVKHRIPAVIDGSVDFLGCTSIHVQNCLCMIEAQCVGIF